MNDYTMFGDAIGRVDRGMGRHRRSLMARVCGMTAIVVCVTVGPLSAVPPRLELAAASGEGRSTDKQTKKIHGKEWSLVWSDEFGKPGLPDPANWGYEEGLVRNNEKQFYTRRREKNARVEDGNLVIEAHREDYRNADYTSASLVTRGHASWTYGRIEVRAKLPRGRGVWPAIWMLGTNISEVGWPECGEIDIMEYVGFKPHTIHANVHTDAYNHVEGTGKGDHIHVEAPYSEYHVYAIEWYRDHIEFYVDDERYFRFENEGMGNAVWPFDKPHYLILNLAIGGSWGGRKGIDDSIFPQEYHIDYVRVYQQARRGEGD